MKKNIYLTAFLFSPTIIYSMQEQTVALKPTDGIYDWRVLESRQQTKAALQESPDLDAMNILKETPLQTAIHFYVPIETIELLLKAGASVNLQSMVSFQANRSRSNLAPLHRILAQKAHNDESFEKKILIAQLLIRYGAKPLKDDKGRTPLMIMVGSVHGGQWFHKLVKQFVNLEATYYGVEQSTYEQALHDLHWDNSIGTHDHEATSDSIQKFWSKVGLSAGTK